MRCQKPTSSHERTVATGSRTTFTISASGKILVRYSNLAGPVNFMISLFFPWYFTCLFKKERMRLASSAVARSFIKKPREKSILLQEIYSQKLYRSIGLNKTRSNFDWCFCLVFLLTPTYL